MSIRDIFSADRQKARLRVQRELDRTFMKYHDLELMIRIRGRVSELRDNKYDAAEALSKELGSRDYTIIEHAPYVIVPVSEREAKKICSMIEKKRSFFGLSAKISSAIESAEMSTGMYLPELFQRFAEEMGIVRKARTKRLPRELLKEKGYRWNLRMVGAPAAHNMTRGRGAEVLVIDTGVEYYHDQLAQMFGPNKGHNFVNSGNDPRDDNGHGTHCAGIVGGLMHGVAPECTMKAAKVLDRNGSGTNSNVIRAIDYAIKSPSIDVISMSLGSAYPSMALEEICKFAVFKGIIVCAAAGNEYFGPSYPAACEGVISVAAVDHDKRHAEFSNIDPSVDISAPGVNIESTYIGNGFRVLSGTSMATPHVSGIAALAASLKKDISPGDYEKKLKESAEELGKDERNSPDKYGAGLGRADLLIPMIKASGGGAQQRIIDYLRRKEAWR